MKQPHPPTRPTTDSWPWLSWISLSVCVAIFFLLALHGTLRASEASKPFSMRAFHISFRPGIQRPAFYRGLIDQASKLEYNMFILNTGGMRRASYTIPQPGKIRFHKWSHKQVADLFAYARKAGLEPVFEVKVIGKQDALLAKLAKTHPGLLYPIAKKSTRRILNPNYRFPDGKDAYDAIAIPMLDELIALYGERPPRYMLLGIDEIPVEFLESCAKQLNTTTPKLFAELLNRMTGHLLDQGITPILWGDMFLGKALGQPGHGVIGFKYDPRIKSGHATFISQRKNPPSTLTSMNDLTNRDKIIIGDWHYGDVNQGEYPSVDYFQAMGFKDVWGATWYDDRGIRMFARYAAKRRCGGMIATAWHTTISPSVRHLFLPLLTNSSIYFHNPNFEPAELNLTYRLVTTPQADTFVIATEKQPGIFRKSAKRLVYQVQLPKNQRPSENAALIIRSEKNHQVIKRVPLAFEAASHQLRASFTMPHSQGSSVETYGTILQWTNRPSGYMVQKIHPAFFNLTQHQPVEAGKAKGGAWFWADFSNLSADEMASGLLTTTGQIPQILNIENPVIEAPPVRGALNCLATSGWVKTPGPLWHKIATKGMQLDITFKVTGSFKKKDHCALLAFGSYGGGFRLLMARNKTFLLQFARQNGSQPIWIATKAKAVMGAWTTIRVTLTPAKKNQKRVVTLALGQHKPIRVTLPNPIPEQNASALGLGMEFRPLGSIVKTWNNFPGQIRKVTIRPYGK